MESLNHVLLVGALILLVALLLGAASSRVGLPFLLVFLVVGMLAGEDGPGGIAFNDYHLSFLVGNLALAVILLDGGLRTRFAIFRVGLRPALVLATVGVVLTASLVAACAAWLFDLDWRLAALLGAIVGSTDAAAVFALLKSAGVRLGDRIAATLEIESGANDPMAVFLTVGLIGLVLAPIDEPVAQLAFELAKQFGIGAGAGIAFGYAAGRFLPRVRLGPGLDALLICAGGVSVFALTNTIGGSGFLAVYLAGVMIANAAVRASDDLLRAMDGMAWLAQSGMFLLLGLLVTPHELTPVLVPALGVAAFLMLVARPAAVWACLAPFRFPAAEVWYIGWMGLRGAVPIVLAIFPLLAGVEGAELLFNVAFVAVLVSLLGQGTTVGVAARALGVALPPRGEPLARVQLTRGGGRHELMEFDVEADSPVCGAPLALIDLPPGARAVSVMRSGQPLAPDDAGPLAGGDVVAILASEPVIARLEEMFLADAAAATEKRHRSFGEFFIDADAPAADVLALYGVTLPAYVKVDGTLGELVRSRLLRQPVEGDAVALAGVVLTVAEMDGARISRVALRLPRARPPSTCPK
ncbi:MAG TPA: potassium/proton antiporter [Burkholderiales bacterium]|nr:potassium/proton antiporter [Burkholderiales bacterium]